LVAARLSELPAVLFAAFCPVVVQPAITRPPAASIAPLDTMNFLLCIVVLL
jgi:hypothetical protein